MFKRVIVFISAIIGLSFGVTFGPAIWAQLNLKLSTLSNPYLNAFIFGLLFIIVGTIVAPFIERVIRRLIDSLNRLSIPMLLLGLFGMGIGLILGYLLGMPFVNLEIPFISSTLPFVLSFIFALVGYHTAMSRREEFINFFRQNAFRTAINDERPTATLPSNHHANEVYHSYKILDTSAIIDGRIVDVIETGFMEGIILIPNFVLQELQHIADASDSLKRSKGRRGLDILNELQKNNYLPVEFYDKDFEDIDEVDAKLIRLAKLVDGALVTNDYNLNKVAEFQSIPIFNINELANAMKPVLIPGEQLEVLVIKAGTERKQGVAYLNDGTMIVVEDGQYYLNQRIQVEVTSTIQTNAGRMIFAKPVEE